MNITLDLETWEFIALNLVAPITAGAYYTIKHYMNNRYKLIDSTGQKKESN